MDNLPCDFGTPGRGDDASTATQLILFHREEEIAAAEGLEIQTIGLIEQNLVHPGFTLVGWAHGSTTQYHHLGLGIDARLVGNQHTRVFAENVGGVNFLGLQSATSNRCAAMRLRTS